MYNDDGIEPSHYTVIRYIATGILHILCRLVSACFVGLGSYIFVYVSFLLPALDRVGQDV